MNHMTKLVPVMMVFLLAGCGGKDQPPPPPVTAHPLSSPNVVAAQQQLVAALNQCGGAVQSTPQPSNGCPGYNQCWNDLIVAFNLYKSAPLLDGTLAIDHPFFFNNFYRTVGFFGQNFIKQNGVNQLQQLQLYMNLTCSFNQFGGGGLSAADRGLILAQIPPAPSTLVGSGANPTADAITNAPRVIVADSSSATSSSSGTIPQNPGDGTTTVSRGMASSADIIPSLPQRGMVAP